MNSLSRYNGAGFYETSIFALYQDFYFKALIDQKWADKVVSSSSINLLSSFYECWMRYIEAKSYGRSFFVYYDPEWYEIVENKLIPALTALDIDLERSKINENITDGIALARTSLAPLDTTRRPNDNEVIWKMENIYKVLQDNELI